MNVAIITVGEELLSGEIENTNATWLSARVTEKGASVRRITVLPDDLDVIADRVRSYGDSFDAVIVTGGLGDTPDDVTLEAVSEAFGVELVVDDLVMADLEKTLEEVRERRPGFSVNERREASIPRGARPLVNQDGLSPGCVLENVHVLPGIPREMKSMFQQIEDEFGGDVRSRSFRTSRAEAALVPVLEAFHDRFEDVTIGCYPNRGDEHNTLRITGETAEALDTAERWLKERVELFEDD